MEINNKKNLAIEEGQQATHSGWMQYFAAFANYRDECTKLSRIVNGGNFEQAVESLNAFYASLYTLAQQVFSFYEESTGERLTEEWLEMGKEINDFLNIYHDPLMHAQMVWEFKAEIPKEMKMKLFSYFNKINRMAAESGLLVNKEDKSAIEPKKGLIGLKS